MKFATVTSGTFSGMNEPFYIARSMYGSYYEGNLREMSFWNYEKTSTQIASDMSTTFTGSETGLVGYWPMTSSSTPGNDLSMANHDATMTNGPVPATDPVPAVFLADIRQSTDYSPFGVILKNRDLRLTAGTGGVPYRYSFQGQERDDEIKGAGKSYDFGARMYDSRLGRWLTIDPLAGNYPDISPYTFVGNMPTIAIDPDGKRIIIVVEVATKVEGREVKIKLALDAELDRDLLDKYAPNFMKSYDIAKSTSLEGVEESLKTGADLINKYEQSETEDLYVTWVDDAVIPDISAVGKNDIKADAWSEDIGTRLDPSKKNHLVQLNKSLQDEFMIENILLKDGSATKTLLHEILFHIYWEEEKGVPSEKQHDNAYGTTRDVHKDSSANAQPNSPDYNLRKNSASAAAKYMEEEKKSTDEKSDK